MVVILRNHEIKMKRLEGESTTPGAEVSTTTTSDDDDTTTTTTTS